MGTRSASRRIIWLCAALSAVVDGFVPPPALHYGTFSPRVKPITSLELFDFRSKKQENDNVSATALPVEGVAPALAVDDASSDVTASSIPPPPAGTPNPKLKILKDKMWIRETKEDLTAAEFACSLEAMKTNETQRKKQKRAVDYENLLSKLEGRVLDLCCDDKSQCEVTLEQQDLVVPSTNGKGSLVYNEAERKQLLTKILKTRHALKETMQGHLLDPDESKTDSPFSFDLPDIPDIRMDIPKSDESSDSNDSLLYVREDGTVDWDGALQDRAALKNFGIAVWARINGEDPDEVDEETVDNNKQGYQEKRAVMAKIDETDAIRLQKARLDELQDRYNKMKMEHTALLNSAISAGQAVANINLATLDPTLRNKIRQSTEALEKMEEEVTFQTLMYELERIYTYLDGEMVSSNGYIPLQDRLNVAEFGLLESQISSLDNQMQTGEIVDPDVLAVVLEQLTDFKRRLGIDFYVTGLTLDRQAISTWLKSIAAKTKDGFTFYVKGCRLFWNDIVFATSLIGRALRGYTLKPREVRNLRRTVKDIVTFIPVVIILIIPLSPVGHVLVFGAIQRFFPGFFPSCFTESRQNLLQLYESTEYSELTINETWKEKLSRFSEAILFVLANFVRRVYTKVSGQSLPEFKKENAGEDKGQKTDKI